MSRGYWIGGNESDSHTGRVRTTLLNDQLCPSNNVEKVGAKRKILPLLLQTGVGTFDSMIRVTAPILGIERR